MHDMSWIIWALLSAIFAALTAILAKIGLDGVGADLATAIRTPIIMAFAWLFAFMSGELKDFSIITSRAWIFLILSGLATGTSWIFYFRALKAGPASRVAPIDRLSIVFVLIFAALVLRERLQWHQYAGVVLILAGTLLVTLQRA